MESLPPELCIQVMGMIQTLSTLGNFILSQQYLFRMFTTYRAGILKSVITNQFGSHAKAAIFLATTPATNATSEATRVTTIKLFHQSTWTTHNLPSPILRKLTNITHIVDRLVSIFNNDLAPDLWIATVKSRPPSSFPHAGQRIRTAVYRYWILCHVFSNFTPSRRCFFWASSLERSTFDEFYSPLQTREVLHMAFFEFCFFPRFMADVCGDCVRGTCDRQIHKLIFRGGPEELLRIRQLHHPGRTLRRDGCADWETSKGLMEDLLHGVDIASIGDSALHGEALFGWAMFEMDGLDERQENAVKLVCGDMAGG